MIYPWTIGQEWVDEHAALTAVTSCGFIARAQLGVARLVSAHARFLEDRVPVVIEQVGDYIADMQKLNAGEGLYFLVQTPEQERGRASEWTSTFTVQAIETPAVNRSKRGGHVTALRACEMARASLEGRAPDEGWTPLRATRLVRVQSDVGTCSYALVLTAKTLMMSEAAPPT